MPDTEVERWGVGRGGRVRGGVGGGGVCVGGGISARHCYDHKLLVH